MQVFDVHAIHLNQHVTFPDVRAVTTNFQREPSLPAVASRPRCDPIRSLGVLFRSSACEHNDRSSSRYNSHRPRLRPTFRTRRSRRAWPGRKQRIAAALAHLRSASEVPSPRPPDQASLQAFPHYMSCSAAVCFTPTSVITTPPSDVSCTTCPTSSVIAVMFGFASLPSNHWFGAGAGTGQAMPDFIFIRFLCSTSSL